eukprot:RCo022488
MASEPASATPPPAPAVDRGKGHNTAEHARFAAQWESEQDRLLAQLVVDRDEVPWALVREGAPPLRRLGGVDLSFVKDNPDVACAALVVVEYPSLALLYEDYRMVRLELPYISGFLAFREVPGILSLLEELSRSHPELMPEVVLVDGNGVLHPRGMGMACHLGVVSGLPTIGVAKTFLNVDGLTKFKVLESFRKFRTENPSSGAALELVGSSGRVWGAAMCGSSGSVNPVFVSQGHRLSL